MNAYLTLLCMQLLDLNDSFIRPFSHLTLQWNLHLGDVSRLQIELLPKWIQSIAKMGFKVAKKLEEGAWIGDLREKGVQRAFKGTYRKAESEVIQEVSRRFQWVFLEAYRL